LAATETSYRKLPQEWKGIVPTEVFLSEAIRIVERSKKSNMMLRVMGGVGIAIHSNNERDLAQRLGRIVEGKQEYTDLDFAGLLKERNKVSDFFANELSYIKRKTTMSSAASQRLIFFHPDGYFTVDVLMDKLLVANHPIDFRPRLGIDPLTITLADLLLEKIQMWEAFSEKDLKDCLLLIKAHKVSDDEGDSDNEAINSKYIAELLSNDWGFYYTATMNLKKIKTVTKDLEKVGKEVNIDPSKISSSERDEIVSKIELLLHAIEAHPKSLGWKMRSKVGTTKKWYNLVETPATVGDFGIWRLRDFSSSGDEKGR
jgi:hypothetical protein